ncbi:MAG: LysR family transcriptional regulator [Cellulomonadaceae bacterium]
MLDVRRLQLLRELKLRGTLAAVAEAMHLSPSSVSQQLAQLEREAGAPLLRKVGRRVQLTAQAEILVTHTAALLDRLERAEADMAASLHEATGTLRIAAFQSAVLALVPGALRLLTAEQPLLRVTMTQREPESALYETWMRDFDVVVAEQYPGHAAPWPADLDRVPLVDDAIRLGVPPAGPLGRIRSIAEARRAPWVMEPGGVASRHWAEQVCRSAGFEPDVRFETADLQAQIRLVESGHAVALVPDLMWLGREPTLTLVDLAGDPHRTVFTSVRSASARRPDVVACRDALARTVAQVLRRG